MSDKINVEEDDLRTKCGLDENGLIYSSLGYLDILNVKDGVVTLGVIADGRIFQESCESVINKLRNPCTQMNMGD